MRTHRAFVPGIVATGGAILVLMCIVAFQDAGRPTSRRPRALPVRSEAAPSSEQPLPFVDRSEAPALPPQEISLPTPPPEVQSEVSAELRGLRLAEIRGALVEGFRDLLEEGLSDPATEVRAEAIRALQSAPPQEDPEMEWVSAAFFQRYPREEDGTIRRLLLETLSSRQAESAMVPILLDLWDVERDAGIRAIFVRQLAAHGAANPEEVRAILSVWGDQDRTPEVRDAIDVVNRLGNARE